MGCVTRSSFQCGIGSFAALMTAVIFSIGKPSLGQTFIADTLENPFGLELYNGNIYFIDTKTVNADTLQSAPILGGTATTLLSGLSLSDSGQLQGINDPYTVDSSGIYGGYGGYVNYAVFASPLEGGSPTKIAAPSGGIYISKIGNDVFYSNGFNEIDRTSISGANATPVSTGVWVRSFAADASDLYFQDYYSQTIKKFDFGSHSLTTLTGALAQNTGVVIDAENIYLNRPGGGIDVVSKSGGTPTPLISGGGIGCYTAANGSAYFVTGNLIENISISTGTPMPLMQVASGTVTSMSVNGGRLYYAVANGSVGKLYSTAAFSMPPNYKQFTGGWEDQVTLNDPKPYELHTTGCFVSSASMVLDSLGHSVTPGTLNTFLSSRTSTDGNFPFDYTIPK